MSIDYLPRIECISLSGTPEAHVVQQNRGGRGGGGVARLSGREQFATRVCEIEFVRVEAIAVEKNEIV